MAIHVNPRGTIVVRDFDEQGKVPSSKRSKMKIKVPTRGDLIEFDEVEQSEGESNLSYVSRSYQVLLGRCLVGLENFYRGGDLYDVEKDENGHLTEDCLDTIWDQAAEIIKKIQDSGKATDQDLKNS